MADRTPRDPGAEMSLHGLWGEPEWTARHQRRHLRHLVRAPGDRVLEIGCDRGVMLQLLHEAGADAYGIDLNPAAVRSCRERGLDVEEAEALDHLRGLADERLSAVLCAHVIEHMAPEAAFELLRQCRRTLRPGGRLVLVTPNARDLRAFERFWMDPTHVRPYPQKLLVRMFGACGLEVVEVAEAGEPVRDWRARLAKAALRLWFLGQMFRGDLIVVGERPA